MKPVAALLIASVLMGAATALIAYFVFDTGKTGAIGWGISLTVTGFTCELLRPRIIQSR
ncbi:hypothetical protein [Sediminibacterium soli]|uniref:hypothetical protein n=1 Tax=Sediminibacterium soli TaxID=2698829 RepID=UPI0013799B5D|nr:hypothetical protein [Sediminibacterium soli]NCI46620.1 hypothetical protein [Sediminibacterium soli]